VKHKQILTSVFTIILVLSLVMFMANQPPASAHATFLGKKGKNLEIELSPQQRLFHPHEDGYFYPGSKKITKNLEVINVGDVPFRICRFNATFYDDTNTHLADGLEIEISELGKGKGEKPNLLYNGTLSSLTEGVEVNGKSAISQEKSVTLQFTVWMPETAGNEYQGLTMTADIAVTVRFPPSK
jgi:hypothetical protein